MILVAIGANLPGPDGEAPLCTCRWALARLAATTALRLCAVSSWYRSPAWPPSDQPDYVNGAAALDGDLDPAAALAALHAIEAEAGRVRSVPNAARRLDLDLLAVDNRVVDSPGLVLPHKRLHLRPFVLAPLAEIAPGWRHPLFGLTAAEMLAGLDCSGLDRIAAPEH